ncbi:PAS domain S-box protein [Patescibacteria group bacterium]
MTNFLLKQKKVFVLTFTFLIIALTTAFVVGESSLNVNHDELHTFIISEHDMETVQSEEHYRELLNNQTDDIFILKNDTTIEYSGEEWREKFGYFSDEIDGENFFTLVHPKDLPYFANEIVNLVNTGERIDNIGPFRIKDYEDEYFLFIANAIPLVDEKGILQRIGLILIDVSIPLGGSSGVPTALAFNPFAF